ncbi:MAG: replication initiator protein [Microvirus sp.]|nr:MAG: replication initiator protein [Microvirus sp.]
MGCNYPRSVWKRADEVTRHASTGVPITVRKRGFTFRLQEGYREPHAAVPCGQCLGCRLDWAADWALRCEKEAKCWPQNSFVTLTYSDSELPIGSTTRSTVSKREFQLFMKRLRKELGDGIRFFASGEYGDTNDRAHYHALLFNCAFPDRVLWSKGRGHPLYRSVTLERLWPYGFSTIGDVNFRTASYVARYVVKKLRGSLGQQQYADREPPFVLMSRNPGIGAAWFVKHSSDVFPEGSVVYGEGRQRRAPRYFDKLHSREKPFEVAVAKGNRKIKAAIARAKSPPQTLEARETNLKARLSLSGRPL